MSDESRSNEGMSQLEVTRRDFLKVVGASTAGAVVFTGCQPPEREFMAQSRVRLAEDILSSYQSFYATACQQCGAGCGLIVRVIEGRSKKVEGNPDHPLNRGKVCVRGQAAVQEEYHPDRIQGPMRATAHGSGQFTPISWDEALNQLATRLRDLRGSGRGSALTVLTAPERGHRGMLLDRFARSFGGQWLTVDPLSEAPLHEAVRRMFGQDTLPEFDIERARYVLSFGADFLGTWLSPVHYNVEYGVFRQGNYRVGQFQPRQGTPRGYLVHVDPRFSQTAANADEWLPVQPGAEGVLAMSMAQVILAENLADPDGARAFGSAASLSAFSPDRVAEETGVSADQIRHVARDFARRRPSLAIGGGSAGAHTNGVDNLTAILGLNVLVGGVGREGGIRFNSAAPFGVLASSAPASLADSQRLVDRLRNNQVDTVFVHGTDVVHDLPGALGFRDALRQAPFIVSFSSFMNDTTLLADLILPTHLPLEDWGDDIPDPAPGFQAITMQQPVVRPFYDTRSFGDLLLVMAEEIGGPVGAALPWTTFKDVLRDAARELQQQRRGSVQEPDFERFWMRLLQTGGWWDEASAGRAAGDAGAAGAAVQRLASNLPRARFAGENDFPFSLVLFEHNSLGKGEGAHLPWLQATPDPVTSAVWNTWAELNPRTARELGVGEGDIVRVESQAGAVEVPVYLHPAAPPTVVAIPLGQGHARYGRWATGRGANPMALVAPMTDQTTGALAYGATRVRLTKTGRRMGLAKLEGSATAIQIPEQRVIQVTREA
jgi:anaerobic selenocysteine-containing dehydrogenase